MPSTSLALFVMPHDSPLFVSSNCMRVWIEREEALSTVFVKPSSFPSLRQVGRVPLLRIRCGMGASKSPSTFGDSCMSFLKHKEKRARLFSLFCTVSRFLVHKLSAYSIVPAFLFPTVTAKDGEPRRWW